MIDLFRKAMQSVCERSPNWYAAYKDICEKVESVNDWNDPEDASDALLHRVIYDADNGVASVGQALCAWPVPRRPSVNSYREMLNRIKDVRSAKYLSDAVAKCREEFLTITNGSGSSIFNRIVSAFLPGMVSPVMSETDFNLAWDKLVQGGYINDTGFRVRVGEDPWCSKNLWLMDYLRNVLPDGECEGAGVAIDDYSRGTFVWGVCKYIDMDDWIILRNAKSKVANKVM